MNLSEIKTNPNNPRVIKDARFKQLKKSIEDLPHMMVLRPIVVDETGTVLGGNMRLEALKSLGYKDIPDEWVKRTDELSEEQKKEFVIKDNAGFGEWDWDQLANEWSEYPLADWGVDVPEDWAASPVVEEDESAVAEMIDKAAELQEKWKVERGQIWEIGRHRLMCGDSVSSDDVGLLFGGSHADLLFTSPPYNQELPSQSKPTGMHKTNAWFNRLESGYADNMPEDQYQEWQVRVLTLWVDYVKDGGAFFYNHKHRYRNRRPIIPLDWIRRSPWALRQEIVWDRRGGVAANAGMFIPGDERIYWLEKEGDDHVWNGVGDNRTTVWNVSPQKNDGFHVCPFPVEIVSISIKAVSPDGGLIGEPFNGSGTTIVAAHETGRKCYGMEIEPKYCAVTLERLSALGLTPRLTETKQ